jgi:SAM-dependent MidA family methyltransferase
MTEPDDPATIPLPDRLRRRIERGGPITFAAFMEAALYDPAGGFYGRARLPVGEAGDFVTSPHVSPVFGRLVARQVEEFWELLDRPDPFAVIEAGAGDGTLARQIIEALSGPVRTATRYIAVETASAARKALRALPVEVVARLEEIEAGLQGCLIANELLDNLPFHRLRGSADGAIELFVGLDDHGFTLVEAPVSSSAIGRLAPSLPPGHGAVVSPAALDFIDRAAGLFRRGYLWIVDYGIADPGAAPDPSVHGYRGHRLEEDVLVDPGSRDITAGVDFDALTFHAAGRGLAVWGPIAQREALLTLGFRQFDDAARGEQVEAISARRGIEALHAYSERNRATLLLARGGLGDFLVACFGTGVERPPRAFAGRL